MQLGIPVLIGLAIVAVIWDLRCRRIPNLLSGITAAFGLIWHGAAQGLWSDSVLGAGVGVIVLCIPFLLGGIGGGDLKFLAALGFGLGFGPTLFCSCVMAIAGAVLALGMVKRSGWVARRVGRPWLQRAGVPEEPVVVTVPYAVAILSGLLVTALLSFHGLSVKVIP